MASLRRQDAVSSGLTSRPSLSGQVHAYGQHVRGGVVGVNLPTFVERANPAKPPASSPSVVGVNLPTFVERSWPPSRGCRCGGVSSGLTSRPSLSGAAAVRVGAHSRRVVGVNLPTFVERPSAPPRPPRNSRVVGVNLPTFVERRPPSRCGTGPATVSSGLTSRPSLSGCRWRTRSGRRFRCRRG